MRQYLRTLFAAVLVTGLAIAQTAQWQDVSPSDGGFTVTMPAKPEYNSDGSAHFYRAPFGDQQFTMGYLEVPAEASTKPDELFDSVISGVAEEGKLDKQENLELQGHKGRSFQITWNDGHVGLGRTYVVPNRLVILLVRTKPQQAGGAEVKKFLGSLVLK